MSKSNNTTKRRQEALTMAFTEPVSIDSYSIDECGNVKMYSDGIEKKPLTVHFEKFYEREKKNKTTVYFETQKSNIDMYSILCDYDYLIALDTNDQGFESYSVGLIYRIYKDPLDGTKWYLEYLTGVLRIFDNRNNGEGNSSELIALYELICFFQKGNIINDFNDKKSLFVVDHNQMFLDDYNSRRKHLLNGKSDSWVPSNVHLMHATADSPNDSIFNQIIRECDKEANRLKNPEARTEMFSHVKMSSSKELLIDDSKYTIVNSGCKITDKVPCSVELRYEDTEKTLDIIIHFAFKNDEGDIKTYARSLNMKAYFLCMNFHGLVGLGLSELLKIGELNGRNYYLKCWISDMDKDSGTKKIEYVIFAEK